MLSTKFQVIWCTSKDIMGIYLIFGKFGKKVWGRVINPLWCLKAPSPATKKWIFEFYTKFGFRNHLQTFWPRWLVKSELSLGLGSNQMKRCCVVIASTNVYQTFNIFPSCLKYGIVQLNIILEDNTYILGNIIHFVLLSIADCHCTLAVILQYHCH